MLGTKLSQHSWQAAYPKYLLVTVNSDIIILYAKYFEINLQICKICSCVRRSERGTKSKLRESIFYLIVSDRGHIWFLVLLAVNTCCAGCSKPWQHQLPSVATATTFCQLCHISYYRYKKKILYRMLKQIIRDW